MSTAATMQQPPVIPPRPSRSQEKDNGSSVPAVPPRPAKRFNRSVSPNPDRFAPSPLNEAAFASKNPNRYSSSSLAAPEFTDRPGSVDLPSIGQEGQEYAAAIDELNNEAAQGSRRQSASSPEQTRTVGDDIKLHAPKPTMAGYTAKQRVAAVTRTDSDKAASYGIGRPSSEDPYPRSIKKKASTTSQVSHDSHIEDEHGIPAIGQRVPLFGNAGDVQAPTPVPAGSATPDSTKGSSNHARKSSQRSTFGSLPQDCYGLHGHGVENTDKLEKAYYEKHPEAKKFDLYNHNLHERVKDYSMSSEELNKIVRDTASRGPGAGTTEHMGTPSELVGFQAAEEYTSRMSSPRPTSAASKRHDLYASPLKNASGPEITVDGDEVDEDDVGVIHVDEPGRRSGSAKLGDEHSAIDDGDEGYDAPILASDEVAKGPTYYETAAVELPPERRGSTYEMERPKSRSTSRPASVYSQAPEIHSTPLENVEEYEPLFPEDEKAQSKGLAADKPSHHRFPSRDVWEDAPDSVHDTAEVSTPEPFGARKEMEAAADTPARDDETPAQAFARKQEELAELEDRNPDNLMQPSGRPRSWVEAQPQAQAARLPTRPPMAQRFPSRDVWEDTPDSLQLQTTVSTPQQDEQDPQSATSPVEQYEKPAIPARPAKKLSGDEKPTIPDRPKPQIPARPAKPSAIAAREPEAAPKQKPAVPARPMGGKIAALQAGFMSDLNKRLQLGPQAPKKEEDKAEEPVEEVKEKAPLSDARKGRARGPQRRAPSKTASPSGATAPLPSSSKPVLSFSMTRTLWSINEEGTMTVEEEDEPSSVHLKSTEVESKSEDQPEPEETAESESSPKVEETTEKSKSEETAHEEAEPASEPSSHMEETKTLATNTAGESILEETVVKKPEGDQVADVEAVKDDVVN